MFFLLFFSLAIVAITVTDLPIVIFLLRSLPLILYVFSKYSPWSSQYRFAKKYFLIASCASGLALGSRQIYQFRYSPPAQQSRYLSTGVILDLLGSGKYLYSDNHSDYLLYTQKTYTPGNKIRLVARNSIILSGSLSLQNLSRQSIFYSGFNGQKRSKMKGYNNILYETNSILIETGTIQGISKLRYGLYNTLDQTYQNKKTAGLVLGMLIGDKSKFSKSEYQLFINSGLVHLVAVSGGNIVMLVTFLTMILFFIPFYGRVVFILLVIIGYGIICGLDSSVLRAVLMGGLSLVALLVGRGTSLRNLLGLVYVSMLLYNPYFLVYDVGFLLSFSAVVGIIFIEVFKRDDAKKDKKQQDQKSIPNTYFFKFVLGCKNIFYRIRSNYLKPSIGATLGIFPVIIFFMGQINIGGIVGNIFVLPLVPFIMIGGGIGGFLPQRMQKYYIPIIDFLVQRNYKIAEYVDTYGIIIVAKNFGIKIIIFVTTIVGMIVVIRTLTNPEDSKTKKDTSKKLLDREMVSSYDQILGTLPVENKEKITKTQDFPQKGEIFLENQG